MGGDSLAITILLPYAGKNGGVRVALEHAKGLADRGHRVTLVSRPRRRPGWRRGVKRLLSGKSWHPGHTGSFEISDALEHHVLRHHGPYRAGDVPDGDAVIATWWQTARDMAALPRQCGERLYMVQHDERLITPSLAAEVEKTYRLSARAVVVADWLGEMLRREFDHPAVDVVPNAVDLALFDAPPRMRHAKPCVGLMVSNAKFKRTDLALEAIARVRKHRPNLEIVGFGSSVLEGGLSLPEGTRFEANPAQSRIAALYAQADVWLMSSDCEGYGLPVLEAMACRTPVVGTATGAAPELLGTQLGQMDETGRGVVVPVGDVEAMAQGLEQVLGLSPEAWRAMSDRAYATARRWTWSDATQALERSIRATLGGVDDVGTAATDARGVDDLQDGLQAQASAASVALGGVV